MNLWSPYPQNSEPNNTGYKKCVICYLKENQLSVLGVLAQWYSLHLGLLDLKKGLGTKPHWCAQVKVLPVLILTCGYQWLVRVVYALVHKR